VIYCFGFDEPQLLYQTASTNTICSDISRNKFGLLFSDISSDIRTAVRIRLDGTPKYSDIGILILGDFNRMNVNIVMRGNDLLQIVDFPR